MRVGSILAELALKPLEKIYPYHRSNCLYYFNKTCKICASCCPVGAITSKWHDKDKCSEYVHGTIAPKKVEYAVKIIGCGLCQTKVPCGFEIPKLIQTQQPPGKSRDRRVDR